MCTEGSLKANSTPFRFHHVFPPLDFVLFPYSMFLIYSPSPWKLLGLWLLIYSFLTSLFLSQKYQNRFITPNTSPAFLNLTFFLLITIAFENTHYELTDCTLPVNFMTSLSCHPLIILGNIISEFLSSHPWLNQPLVFTIYPERTSHLSHFSIPFP